MDLYMKKFEGMQYQMNVKQYRMGNNAILLPIRVLSLCVV